MQNQNLNLFKPRKGGSQSPLQRNQSVYVFMDQAQPPMRLVSQAFEAEPEYLGICFDVENNDTIDMMCDLKTSLKIEIIDL